MNFLAFLAIFLAVGTSADYDEDVIVARVLEALSEGLLLFPVLFHDNRLREARYIF